MSADGGPGHSAVLAVRTQHGSSELVSASGTVGSVTDIVLQPSRDPFTDWTVMAACTRAGRGAVGTADVLGVPVVGDLHCVTEHVKSGRRYSVVASVTPKTGWSGHRRRQPAWDLDVAGVELVVNSPNSKASDGG